MAKPKFGDYGMYVDGKMVGSVCDDRLFARPTLSGRIYAEPVSDAPPYSGAKLREPKSSTYAPAATETQ